MNRRRFLTRGFALTTGGIFVPRILKAQLGDPAFVSSLTQPAAAESGQTFLVDEGFEGTGLPASWADNSTGGTRDFDYVSTVLDGSQSLYYQDPGASNGVIIRTLTFAGQDQIYVSFRVQEVTGHMGSGAIFLYVENSSNTSLGTLTRSGGSGALKAVPAGSAGTGIASPSLSTSLWRKVKVRYTKGTGANSALELWMAASGDAAWGTSVVASDGTATTQAAKVRFNYAAGSTSNGMIIDKVRISTTDIAVGDA